MDAGATLVFVGVVALLFYRAADFLKRVDKHTLEASDYTVFVQGLPPDADALEIGRFFSKFGEVGITRTVPSSVLTMV